MHDVCLQDTNNNVQQLTAVAATILANDESHIMASITVHDQPTRVTLNMMACHIMHDGCHLSSINLTSHNCSNSVHIN